MRRPRTFPSLIALAAFTVAATLGACAKTGTFDIAELPVDTADARITALLDHVKVLSDRPQVPGYERSCEDGYGCVFGTAWKDVDRNGCDTRNDVLARQLTDVVFKPGTRQCAVAAGDLRDPYTGKLIHFIRSDGGAVEIDHVYPLAMAWDMGADTWVEDRRIDFANDQANLLATGRAANRSKSDKGPAEWTDKVAPDRRCAYVKRFLEIALGYDLPITQADADSIRSTASKCS